MPLTLSFLENTQGLLAELPFIDSEGNFNRGDIVQPDTVSSSNSYPGPDGKNYSNNEFTVLTLLHLMQCLNLLVYSEVKIPIPAPISLSGYNEVIFDPRYLIAEA